MPLLRLVPLALCLILFAACGTLSPLSPQATPLPAATPTSSSPIGAPTITPTPNWTASSLVTTAELVTNGLRVPVQIVSSQDGSNRLFILQKRGVIRIVQDGKILKEPFLDLSAIVASEVEQALQGMTLAPDFRTSGVFYLTYNLKSDGALVLARYRVSDDPNVADPASGTDVLVIPHPRLAHHGGKIEFGPDGYLYFSVGDGGAIKGQGVSQEAPKLDSLLGKILRLDVSTTPYSIPPTNPFINTPNARPEILAYGLRNPWRFAIDPGTKTFFMVDVGENASEEVNVLSLQDLPGKNFGWPRMEGTLCIKPKKGCQDGTLTEPVFEYSHAYGCAIVGGTVVQGDKVPELQGRFLFSDYCLGRVWSLGPDGNGGWRVQGLANLNKRVSAITQAEDGDIYLSDMKTGELFRLVVK